MQYVVWLHGEAQHVELEAQPGSPGLYTLQLGGQSIIVEALSLASGGAASETQLSLLIDAQARQAHLAWQDRTQLSVQVGAAQAQVQVLDMRQWNLHQAQQGSAAESQTSQIVAPMPGKIINIAVTCGQQVEAGEGLIVIEAMKMENELRAPRAGCVQQLHVQVGQAVDSDTLLCVIG